MDHWSESPEETLSDLEHRVNDLEELALKLQADVRALKAERRDNGGNVNAYYGI